MSTVFFWQFKYVVTINYLRLIYGSKSFLFLFSFSFHNIEVKSPIKAWIHAWKLIYYVNSSGLTLFYILLCLWPFLFLPNDLNDERIIFNTIFMKNITGNAIWALIGQAPRPHCGPFGLTKVILPHGPITYYWEYIDDHSGINISRIKNSLTFDLSVEA